MESIKVPIPSKPRQIQKIEKPKEPKKEKKPNKIKILFFSFLKSLKAKQEARRVERIEQAKRDKLKKQAEQARQEAKQAKKVEQEKQEKLEVKQKEILDKPKVISKTKSTKNQPKLIFGIIGLAVVLAIGGIGGFFYWWNYLKPAPVSVSHYECQDNQCISVEGEGDNQCQLDVDCQSNIIPVPESLIPVDETKTIELVTGQENLLLDQLRALTDQEQASSTVNRILVKIVGQETDKYINLNSLILSLNIKIPEAIATPTTGSYTLFLYNQEQNSRLGIVINMGESDTLVQDLSDWEMTIVEDLKQLISDGELPEAASEEFQDNIYNNIYIRYMNFSTPDLSLDYALVKGNLIIATSRESMFAIIDALLLP